MEVGNKDQDWAAAARSGDASDLVDLSFPAHVFYTTPDAAV